MLLSSYHPTTWLLVLICTANALSTNTFVILGGTGRIGTAIATHLIFRCSQSVTDTKIKIVLVGRDEDRGARAVKEILQEINKDVVVNKDAEISYYCGNWRDADDLKYITSMADCIIHTAGPFLHEQPSPLREAIAAERCKVYVDVSDPLDFIDASLSMDEEARNSGTSALIAAGAFPGMSNVLAMEAAKSLLDGYDDGDCVKDLRFNYFTAGLGGSGDVNLYITNIGFGEPMVQYENGSQRFYKELSGSLLGEVDFFLREEDQNIDNRETSSSTSTGNQEAKKRVGSRTVFSWPFPEATTVARQLQVRGESSAAMGTAPDLWNTMLGILVKTVPRSWWRSKKFSQFMADFSQPLVKLTDLLLKQTSSDQVGETHAMRVDVVGESGRSISCVQAHESFRRCVGQSCAEFALDLLMNPFPGVQLPEQRYEDQISRKRIIKRLTTTPGTIAFTGAVSVQSAPPPTRMMEALREANEVEESLKMKRKS